ncbi:glycosyltransferase [Gloeocapsa sp. PCC 73106]|uniref:glycosyltransferase n=1 Tax=Gloeocapsa sp. PCC 73106 TaxID=102232 RepID=UPI0002ABCE6E|nr:glycosyltransferase [Gloeocapsa sp. PCC 73106]ELR97340.1 glycosyltransferase [Gloeocapsa sp. PCC 73106]
MRIAIISSGFLPITDGVSITLWYRLRYLSKLGYHVLVFCPDYAPIAHLYPDWQNYVGEIFPNIRVINLPSISFVNLNFERNVIPDSYKIVLEKLQLFKPDIIHVDEPERLWLGFLKRPGLDFARQAKIPCVSFFHTNFIEYLDDYLSLPKVMLASLKLTMRYHRNWIYNGYDLTLVSSPSTANKLTNLGFKKVLNAQLLGVETEKYQREVKEPDYFLKHYHIAGLEKKVKLVFLGRLTPDKGWNFILNSLEQFTRAIACQNLAFLIAGEGNMKEEIAAKMSHFIPNSYFLGRVDPQKVPSLLINSDIYITASEKETRGLTVLEALASGIPVVAPRAGGLVDSIKDGDNGLLFIPQNTDDFIEKTKTLVDNEVLRQQMRVKRIEVLNQYGWEQSVNNLVDIWQSLL